MGQRQEETGERDGEGRKMKRMGATREERRRGVGRERPKKEDKEEGRGERKWRWGRS